MPIYEIATYKVKPKGVPKVKRAIKEFVEYIRENEPRTRMYVAWQERGNPTKFAHVYIFQDEAALAKHSRSEAVKRFEAVYGPQLVDGPVIFTEYDSVAMNQ